MPDSFFLNVYPWLLAVVFLGWAALVIFNLRPIAAQFRPLVAKGSWIAAALVFGAALFVRLEVYPPRHQMYFDEFLHEDAALNIAQRGSYAETLAGGADEYRATQVPAWPGGYHLLLAAMFRVAGPNEDAAFRFNAWLAAFSTVVLFLLVTLLCSDQALGVLGACLWAALPVHVRFSGTTDLSVCSSLWILLSLLCLVLHLRRKETASLLLLAASLAYSVNVRFENLLLIPLAAAAIVLVRGQAEKGISRRQLLVGVLLLCLSAPAIALLLRNHHNGLPGYSDSPLGFLANLAHNLPKNVAYLAGEWPVILILIPASAFAALKAEKEKLWVKAAIVSCVVYLLVCSCHSRGRFSDGGNERLAIPLYLSLVLSACAGMKVLLSHCRRRLACAGAMAVAFILAALPSYGRVPLPRYEAEYRLIKESRPLLPADSYVISYCAPVILVAAQRPAATPFLLLSDDGRLLDTLDRGGAKPLIVFKDVWWYKFADFSRQLDRLLANRYRSSPLKTQTIDGKEYGFYKLTRL